MIGLIAGLIGFGCAITYFGCLITLIEDKKYIIIPIIGIMLLTSGIIMVINLNLDCQNHCQCKGQFHSYDITIDVCNCLSMPKAFADCKDKCEGREPFYNQYTGRCYCT